MPALRPKAAVVQLELWSGCDEALSRLPKNEDGPASVITVAELQRRMSERAGRRVQLAITDNRSTMLSFRARGGTLCVRAHRIFLEAGPEVRDALVRYVGDDDKSAGRLLDRYIAARTPDLPRPPVDVQPAGRVHHLMTIFGELNERYFHGACGARITWGTAGPRRYRRSIQLGCFVAADRLIRIHPSLDQAFVPQRYVAWVVFHEMLHEVFGVAANNGRRCVHPPEFTALEQTFPSFSACKQWEEQNLPRLLAYGATRSRAGVRTRR